MIRLTYVGKRLITLLPVMFVIITGTFFMIRFVPGGPFDDSKALPPAVEANLRVKYHLDESLFSQYIRYISSVAMFDLGPSFKYPDRTVNEIIAESFPVSFRLGLYAMSFALFLGLLAGVLAAKYHNQWQDHAVLGVALVGVSVPNIVLGPILVLAFGIWLNWLPVAGWGSTQEAILPSITLGLIYLAYIARLARAGFLETLSLEYVTAARAKGLSERRVYLHHVIPGGLTPVVSYLGPAFASIFTGSLVVEQIFHVPGLGQYFVQAALNRDYTLAMGTVIFYALCLMLLNLVVDLCYIWMNPRVASTRGLSSG